MIDSKQARVLIVDDEEANIRILERLLRKEGFSRIESVTDPYRVLPIFLSNPPDIILLDLNMPGLDGFAVMQELEQWIDGSQGTFLPVLVLTADNSREARERSLSMGAKDFLTKPFDPVEVRQRIENLLETRQLHVELRRQNNLLEEKVRLRTTELWEMVGRLEEAQLKIRASEEETVTRLSIAAEFRDDETARHILRMSHYSALLAQKAGESDVRCELIRIASRMHDVGKIGTPDSILLKPGPLTADERVVMQQHAEMGYRILARSESELLQLAATIALTHHERLDGTGYPRHLCEGEIPIEGRLAAIADVFDALTSDRVYRPAMPWDQAIQLMTADRGSHFDPDLLDLFIAAMPEALVIRQRLVDQPTTTAFLPLTAASPSPERPKARI